MKLPPLTALTYFNAAALQLSFKAAAKQFCVTEGAISRQIKLLEEYYGKPLFVRTRRGVQLTDAGQRLISVIEPAIQKIFQISQEIRGYSPQFTLSVTTSFAIRWLLPRLANFEATHPNFPINIQAAKNPQKIQSVDYGASIIYVLGDPYHSEATIPANGHFVMAEWLIPVCS
ncbi:MAG: LysR family transcriptional regulator, partial [Colwellia sp.]|nr:LysR family transcriptional regulator [Colwellia sp.]